MKGTILDFDENDKKGLILGEDENRYFFDYEKEWKNKNKNPEIDSTVDFIVKDDVATEIFSLTKKINTIKDTNIQNNQNTINEESTKENLYRKNMRKCRCGHYIGNNARICMHCGQKHHTQGMNYLIGTIVVVIMILTVIDLFK